MKRVTLTILAVLLAAASVFAVIIVSAEADTDKKTVELGETLTYVITVTRQGSGGESPRVTPPSFDGFRVQGTYSGNQVSIINGAATVSTQLQYALMAVKSGEVTIQPAVVTFKNQQTGKYEDMKTKAVTITVTGGKASARATVAAMPTAVPTQMIPQSNIREIKMNLDFRFMDVLPYLIVLLLLIGGIYFLWKKIFGKKPETPVAVSAPARDAAREALIRIKKARDNYKKGWHKEFFSEIYEAIRLFLSDKYSVSLYELTTTEILRKTEAAYAAVLLEQCDLVKFGNYVPSDKECEQAADEAELIIEKYKGA